jgi:hypothetical protein
MAIFNSYVKLPEGNHLVKKTRLPKRVGVIRVSFNDFTTTSLLNDDGGFSVWASRWYVAGWPARNPRLTMSKISFISQALLYVHVCFIYVAHKIVHELHAAVLEKKTCCRAYWHEIETNKFALCLLNRWFMQVFGFYIFYPLILSFNCLDSLPFFGEAAHN